MITPKHITIEIKPLGPRKRGGIKQAVMTCHGCGKVQPSETDAPYEQLKDFIEEHTKCRKGKI